MPKKSPPPPLRNLILVLGDQLDFESAAFDGFDSKHDAVLMMEVAEEATYIAQHKIRLVLFFSAMRHFRDELRVRGWQVYYRELEDQANTGDFASEIEDWSQHLRPSRLIVVQPGDYRVQSSLQAAARRLHLPLEIRQDKTFLCTPEEFQSLAGGSRKLILENFYRAMRRKHGILMDRKGPEAGKWNYDADNRKSLTREARNLVPSTRTFQPDKLTRQVIQMVGRRFESSPGTLKHFDYPVTRVDARDALADFIEHRLGNFGSYQDAMAQGQPYLFHSRLSSSLNLHLITPREAMNAAVLAYQERGAPLNSVEGFVRQVMGWREFAHGVYWLHMPDYAASSALDAELPVPRFLWNAETDMNCVRHAVAGLVDHAYAHHIHRLMVLGLYSLLLGVHPYRFHEWHMSMFVDSIDWVSLPNALGMSQFGDGGLMGTKPYCASGNYIHRMSDYCQNCRYNPSRATGDDACPFTTLYWDFLARHRDRLERNGRMQFQIANLDRREKTELVQIRKLADRIKKTGGASVASP